MSSPSSVPLEDTAGRFSGRAWGTLLVLCGALFLDALDVSMKGVALPSIGAELGMSTSSLQWVVSAYVLGFGGFLLLGGRAADLLGRRRVFLVALAAFLVASGLGGLAHGGQALIAARFATGVSAAFTAPAGLSIITTSFSEGPIRNRALSIYAATGASGFSLGLVVGGLLTDINWRLVFVVPVLMAAATLLGALRLVHDQQPPARTGGFDLPGAISATAGLTLLVFALVEAPERGWASAQTLGAFAGAALLLAVFTVVEYRTTQPLLRLSLLRSGPLVRANLGAMSLLGGWIGTLFILTLYMQQLRGWSALQTGLAVSPCGVVVALLAPRIAAPLVSRFGVAPIIITGLSASVLAYLLILRLRVDSNYAVDMLPTFLLVGIAFALAYGPLNMAATNGVPAHEQGVAGGIVNTSFQIGPALALAAVTAVNNQTVRTAGTTQALLDGFRAALLVPLAIAVLGVLITAPGLRNK